MNRVYRLEQEQFIPRGRDEVFAFFSDATNLQQLTPGFLRFSILTPGSTPIQTGTNIDYRLRILGVPCRWRSRIEDFDAPHHFVDVQVKGPYQYWHHRHEFRSVERGTVMVDRVEYSLPWSILGTIAHAVFVRRMLARIFDFRRQRVAEIFAASSA